MLELHRGWKTSVQSHTPTDSHLQSLAVEAPRGFLVPLVSLQWTTQPAHFSTWTALLAPTLEGDHGKQLLSPLVVALVVAQLFFNYSVNTRKHYCYKRPKHLKNIKSIYESSHYLLHFPSSSELSTDNTQHTYILTYQYLLFFEQIHSRPILFSANKIPKSFF